MLKRLISSLLLGTSIGVSPYVIATSAPSTGIKVAKGENIGFGKRCLLDQELCDLIDETKFKQDDESGKLVIKPEDESNDVEKDYKQQWENFLKTRDDDYCGFGFLESKAKRGERPKINVNNLEKCHEAVIKKIKEEMEKKEKQRQKTK